ncbi:MAG: hypothetical protein V1800_18955 [Candidatus Latescibacterota bacterium]
MSTRQIIPLENRGCKLLVSVFLGIGLLFAQTDSSQSRTVRVYGRVTDEEGAGLPQATISFYGNKPITTTQTDTTGAYSTMLTLIETGIEEGESFSPEEFELFQNYPNPFNPSTVIGFKLPRPQRVKLTVLGLTGQTVKVIADAFFPEGLSHVKWDGTDSAGKGVGAGVYLYRMQTEGFAEVGKMLLLDGGVTRQGKVSRALSLSKSAIHSQASAETSFTIFAGKQGLDLFVEEGFVISSNDTPIEKNIILTHSFPGGELELKRELRAAKMKAIGMEISRLSQRLEEERSDSVQTGDYILRLQSELVATQDMPDELFPVPRALVLTSTMAGEHTGELLMIHRSKSIAWYIIGGHSPVETIPEDLQVVWTAHELLGSV